MGLLKKLKKLGKRILKGVKKRFKKVMKFVGKLANSKFGKILMLAAAVFTGGVALGAWSAWGGFTTTAGGFASKFIGGVNKVMSFMTSGAAGAGGGAAGAAGGVGAVAGTAAEGAQASSLAAMTAGPPTALAQAGVAGSVPGATLASTGVGGSAARPNLLSRAMNFAESNPNIMNIVGGALEGYDEQQMLEQELEAQRQRDRRVEDLWENYDPSGMNFNMVQPPSGYLNRARDAGPSRMQTYLPSASPDAVASYAR